MRPAQRTGTTHPARPADHFQKKVHDTAKLDTSHHILIPSSDTHNHKPHQPYNTTHSSSYPHLLNKTLLVLFKCIEIIAIRILHPCQIQQRPKPRARLIETFKDSQQKFKNMDTHKKKRV